MAAAIGKDSAGTTWDTFLKSSIRTRVDEERFISLCNILRKKTPVGGRELFSLLSGNELSTVTAIDPLVIAYTGVLLKHGLVEPKQVLDELLDQWSTQMGRANPVKLEGGTPQASTPVLYCSVFCAAFLTCLAKFLASKTISLSRAQARHALHACSEWMSALVAESSASVFPDESAYYLQSSHEVFALHESVAIVVMSLTNHDAVMDLFHSKQAKDDIRQFSDSLASFTNTLSRTPELSGRLATIQQSISGDKPAETNGALALPTSVHDEEKLGKFQVDQIVDSEPFVTRGGLLVFVHSYLFNRFAFPDGFLFQYFQTRHKGEIQIAMANLVVASFDVLISVLSSEEHSTSMFLAQSFIVNELPLLINTGLTISFMPINPAMLLQQAFTQIDATVDLSLSAASLAVQDIKSTIDTTRVQLISSCLLHGVVAEAAIPQLLGAHASEVARSKMRQSKQSLTDELARNPQRLEHFLECFGNLDGNASAYVSAVVEIHGRHCMSRDLMSLKAMYMKMLKKSATLVSVAALGQLPSLVQPLYALLKSWKLDDHQGEQIPVYEEFSACILFLTAIVAFFDLDMNSISAGDGKDNDARRFVEGWRAEPAPESAETRDKLVTSWLKALYESESITDSLLEGCSPYDLNDIMPVIMDQTFLATRAGLLPANSQKNGLELLLQPFLIPLLIPALRELMQLAWRQLHDADIILGLMQKLVQPSSALHGEAATMHKVVLSVLSRELSQCLQDVLKAGPERKNATAMLEVVKQHEPFAFAPAHSLKQLQEYLAKGSLSQHVRSIVGALCMWSTPQGGLTMAVPSYRTDLIGFTIKRQGATRTLSAVLDEATAQASHGTVDLALDVATTIVFTDFMVKGGNEDAATRAQTVLTQQRGRSLNLRDALKQEHDRAHKSIHEFPARSEVAVRMHRRVEALLLSAPAPAPTTLSNAVAVADAQMPAMAMVDDIGLGAPLDLDAPVNLDAAVPVQVPQTQDQAHVDAAAAADAALDVAFAPSALDMQLDGAIVDEPVQMQVQGQDGANNVPGNTATDDIFSGLDFDFGLDF